LEQIVEFLAELECPFWVLLDCDFVSDPLPSPQFRLSAERSPGIRGRRETRWKPASQLLNALVEHETQLCEDPSNRPLIVSSDRLSAENHDLIFESHRRKRNASGGP
jgi:hypothetical protein